MNAQVVFLAGFDEGEGEVAAELKVAGDFSAEADAGAGDEFSDGGVIGAPAAIGKGEGAELHFGLDGLPLRGAHFEGGPGSAAGSHAALGVAAHGIDGGEGEFFAREDGAITPLAAQSQGGLEAGAGGG